MSFLGWLATVFSFASKYRLDEISLHGRCSRFFSLHLIVSSNVVSVILNCSGLYIFEKTEVVWCEPLLFCYFCISKCLSIDPLLISVFGIEHHTGIYLLKTTSNTCSWILFLSALSKATFIELKSFLLAFSRDQDYASEIYWNHSNPVNYISWECLFLLSSSHAYIYLVIMTIHILFWFLVFTVLL